MADKSTTSFPTVGETIAHGVPNSPAAQSPHVQNVKKTGNAKGGSLEPATANHRQGALERLGHRGAPVLSHVIQNSPEASLTQRNVVPVTPAISRGQFWDKRRYGQVQQ